MHVALLDPVEKPPGRRFLETGFCPFGLGRRYFHVISPQSTCQPLILINQFNKQLNELSRPPPSPPVKDLPPSLRLPPPPGGLTIVMWQNGDS
ncbi:5181_t:CDS:2 [Paraglomus brasilianum]|uniref:5181_t:CDS:1 n=1 Tax=Paraglomus brasilianum TaxID=144538 RepID=A0A9N9GIT5_9GLOM|nr:5181_t:CDS:2 [Paraglomus brasilianum]